VLSVSSTFVEHEIPASADLLAQAQGGDAEAFGQICRVYETRLLRQAMTLCGNEALAEDLAQDTLVEAWKCLRRYNGRCQFFTWLCAILLNRYRNVVMKKGDWLRLTAPRDEGEGMVDPIDQLVAQDCLPDRATELNEEAQVVRQCVQLLPRKHQQVVYLRFFVDESLDGIAQALGCSLGTVKSRLFHALDKLRSMRALGKPSGSLHSDLNRV